jgi:hypothetical protein
MPNHSNASGDHVNIRPGVSILSVLRHLNYRPWFAMAEFVDNSLQSFLANREALQVLEGDQFKLRVSIEMSTLDGGRLTIRDNAAGIGVQDYGRAFRAAAVPSDRSGLSEFGMGMKSAACWFAPRWTVRTSALGEGLEKTVVFDINSIVHDNVEELQVSANPAPVERHFTEIVLLNLHKPPQGRTVSKIKDHLASIYRVYLRRGALELYFDGEKLECEEPRVLTAPYFKSPGSNPVTWRKAIEFDFGQGQKAHGFAALRETASVSTAGFALFRRNRLIEGSIDESYRPEVIFGKSNSYAHQRLFGELHLEGFEVSHTKDGFRWDENEETFLQILKEHLDLEPMRLLQQAEGYRARLKAQEVRPAAEAAVQSTAETIQREVPQVLGRQVESAPDGSPPPLELSQVPAQVSVSHRQINVELNGQPWVIVLELTTDPAVGDWIEVCDRIAMPANSGENQAASAEESSQGERRVGLRLSLAHPFMERFGGTSAAQIEPLLRVAAALGLAEVAARQGGMRMAGTIRRNINQLLRDALSKP